MAAQRHWIGRSEGADVLFRIEELDVDVPVFTTRPDTLFGSTFFVLAPEHPLVDDLAARSPNGDEIRDYVRIAAAKRGEERAASEAKSGVFTGFYATNPVNEAPLPIWVADYVLMDYGTGAIMAVPAHDERDFQFAQTFGLTVKPVVVPADGEVPQGSAFMGHTENEVLIDSGEFTGLPAPEAKKAIVEWLDRRGRGKPAINFRLRDWGFSRQRYWGCPIPIIYCDEHGIVPVPDEDLPVLLPEIEDFRPKGHAPLASAEEWVNVSCPICGGPARREVDTMDTFVDSSWYFLRYTDPHNDHAPYDRRIADYWGPVDFYQGGVDHATVHMIYARFYMKALNDMDLIGFREPFIRFHGNGWVQLGGTKMSKSKGNVLGPDQFVEQYGADPTRLYSLFIAPADQDMEFTETGLEGMQRFVRRLWRVVNEAIEAEPREPHEAEPGTLTRKAHETIAKVTDDIGRREAFNTPIAAVMELVNELAADVDAPDARFAAETAVSLIQPYAPHVAEELWQRLGHERLWETPWPRADESQLRRDTFELVLQVNGKVRDRIEAPASASQDELIALRQGVAAHPGIRRRQGDPPGDRRPGEARQHRRALADSRVRREVHDAIAAGHDLDARRAYEPGDAVARPHGVPAGRERDPVGALCVRERARRRAGPREEEPRMSRPAVARLALSADRLDRPHGEGAPQAARAAAPGGSRCEERATRRGARRQLRSRASSPHCGRAGRKRNPRA